MGLKISRPEDYRAALYIRLSKEDEGEGPSESVSNQQSMLEDFAQRQCLTIHGIYIDDGYTGANFDRPGFQRMLEDIETRRVNLVITKDLSRLGRDYIMTGHYMERYFPEKQVRYISLLDGIDTGVESTANDITPFRAIMNDMYAKDISKKIKSVKRDKQRKGQFIGGKPVYGYKMHPTEKNKIVIDHTVAPVVRRIFTMALDGTSCREIAARLNAEKVPTPATYAGLKQGQSGPYGGMWSSERISDMLSNETYMGNMVQGRSKKISYKSPKCFRQPRENWVVVENTHEALIDKDAFDKVQQLLESRRSTRVRTYNFLLKGLIYCHECGYPMAVINRKSARGEDCLYLVCRTYQRFTKAGVCTCHTIKEQSVREAVINKVEEICSPYLRQEVLLPLAEAWVKEAERAHGGERELAVLKSKEASLTASLDKMYMDRLNGVLDEGDFERIYLKIKQERSALAQILSERAVKSHDPGQENMLAQSLTESFIRGAWSSRELLVSLIERIELTEHKEIIIHFCFRQPEALS